MQKFGLLVPCIRNFKKFLLIMKLCTLILFISLATASAKTSYSQNAKITLNLDRVTVKDLFEKIEKSSEFIFVYYDNIIDLNKEVSVNAENETIEEILDKVFKSSENTYKIFDRQIVIAKKESSKADIETLLAQQPQKKELSGTVKDNKGISLPGVSVVVKGTTVGTLTDADGKFKLQVSMDATTLVFSFVGMKTREVAIAGKTLLNVVMDEELIGLGEIVAVGYGSVKKSDLTGSVSSVKGDDMLQLPTMRVDQALQGRAAGISVQNTDGEPGGNVTIRIRGGNSILGGNNALIVIDGLQGGNINNLNPNDIESVEILKDASATAIYGARGANGVILITTKKGVIGKPVVSYTFNYGTQSLSHKLDLLNAGDYAQKSVDYAASQNGTVSSPITPVLPFTPAQISALKASGGTDWQNEIYRPAMVQNHQLSISGGTEKIRYFVSGGYVDQQGLVVATKYERYTLRSNLDLKLNNWLSAGVNMNAIKEKGNVPPTGEGTYFGDILGQVINTVARFDPATPVYNVSGNYNFKANQGGPSGNKSYADMDVWNPLATALETKNEVNTITNDISTYLEFKLLEGLSLRVTGAVNSNTMDDMNYDGTKTQPGSGVNGVGSWEFSKYQYYQNSNILTYNKIFNLKHHLTLTGVAEQQMTQSNDMYTQAQGFFSDVTGINDLGSASQINQKYTTTFKTALNSYLGRANYIYDNKYMFTASYRADGSSVFGANHKWGYFPSAAIAWRASEESFIKKLAVFSNLKLRGSWGETGNQGIQPYQSLASVASGFNYPYDATGNANIGFQLGTAANPNLKWESTTQTNLGVDLGFFDERLTATVDVYKKLTTNLLLNQTLPNYTGFPSVLMNVGSIQNKGLEISLSGKIFTGRDFKWTTGANISFNRDKILELANNNAPLPIITSPGGGYNFYKTGSWALKQLRVGQPVDQMYGYISLGTWKTSEAAAALAFGQLPGDAKWKDVNNDGKIDLAGDGNQLIGNAAPKFIYGWNNTFTYKNFDLTFLILGSYGNDIFNAVRIKTEGPAVGTSTNLLDRWTSTNQDTYVPAFTSTLDRNSLLSGHASTIKKNANDTRSSRWVEDGSYIRMKNITLTYNIKALPFIHVSKLAVFATAVNPFTITKYTGYDPEVSSFNRGSRVRAGGLGIDLSNYPSAKTFLCGINLTF